MGCLHKQSYFKEKHSPGIYINLREIILMGKEEKLRTTEQNTRRAGTLVTHVL